MQKLLMVPLDERPCNAAFPSMMCVDCADVELLLPPACLLGNKKRPAAVEALGDWVRQHIDECDAAILSADMLVYGGIVPSRLHHLSAEEALCRLGILRDLKQAAPQTKLYAFSLIMRAPAYNSSDEEPDYYEQYGRALYEIGAYTDQQAQTPLTPQESESLSQRRAEVPPEVLKDFANRREVNRAVNEAAAELVREGVLDFLVIPLDDCARYGWAASEQRALRSRIVEERLSDRVFQYSGADEVGSVLLARAVNGVRGRVPAVYINYSAIQGSLIVPKYEDRPLGENLKWQIAAAGGRICATPEEADFVLLVNAPTAGGEAMGEASQPYTELDASYSSQRCLPALAMELRVLAKRKPVALADLAFANGADCELMRMLQRQALLCELTSYAGWNTAANAAGTCIAHMMLRLGQSTGSSVFTKLRLLEDWGYMADLRQQAIMWVTERGGRAYAEAHEQELAAYLRDGLQRYADECELSVHVDEVTFPWRRLFEIGIQLTCE
ncbi:MAG: DUF4127 family protein [Clostridia bacterium]